MANPTGEREAFDAYWNLGRDRSLAALHGYLLENGWEVSLRTLESWSARGDWRRRLVELERRAQEAGDEARLAAIREMNARHAQEGIFLQQRGAQWLQALPAGGASPEAAIRAVVEGARLERLARGEVTERTSVSAEDPRLQELSDEQLDRLLELAGDTPLAGEGASRAE